MTPTALVISYALLALVAAGFLVLVTVLVVDAVTMPSKLPGMQPPMETCRRCDGAGGDEWTCAPCTDCLGEGVLPANPTDNREN